RQKGHHQPGSLGAPALPGPPWTIRPPLSPSPSPSSVAVRPPLVRPPLVRRRRGGRRSPTPQPAPSLLPCERSRGSSSQLLAMTKKRNRRPQPLAPPPQSSALRSRKRARQVTTLFHKYTRERDAAVARAKAGGCEDCDFVVERSSGRCLSSHQTALLDEVRKWDEKISEIGGREEYQRASQMNTSLFSTSKWVLGIMGRWGWLDGLPLRSADCPDADAGKRRKRDKVPRRDVRLLEIGAINTQLLDAAERKRTKNAGPAKSISGEEVESLSTEHAERVYHLNVKAIDIRSTNPRIKQVDFFDLPLPDLNEEEDSIANGYAISKSRPYDVIVNSMVINCLTTPGQRGRMLSLCYRHLLPGGVCFLTLPKLCLTQSKSMSRSYFEEILMKGIGFEILQEFGRESPKVTFFVLRRPKEDGRSSCGDLKWDERFARVPDLHRGKQFRNPFAVTLSNEEAVR
ncbi:hypothetical protein ACHAWF_010948, partial [Thalassiosira exigua]